MHKLSKYVWPFGRENLFSLKKILKRPFSAAENWHHFISGGPGGKTVDTRSTFGAPLKTLGYNGSNYVAKWKVGGKKIVLAIGHQFFLRAATEICKKLNSLLFGQNTQKRKDIEMGHKR